MIAAEQERLGAFQISGCLYPDFQIPGSGVAELTDIARESLFQRHRRRVQPCPDLQIPAAQFDTGEVFQPPECDILLQLLHLYVIAERQQKRFQRFPKWFLDTAGI